MIERGLLNMDSDPCELEGAHGSAIKVEDQEVEAHEPQDEVLEEEASSHNEPRAEPASSPPQQSIPSSQPQPMTGIELSGAEQQTTNRGHNFLTMISAGESKLNKLLQTPTINKINYMDNYKLICPSSTSITSPKVESSTLMMKLPLIKSNQKSVIQKVPGGGGGGGMTVTNRDPPSATITSVQQMTPQPQPPQITVSALNMLAENQHQVQVMQPEGSGGKTIVIINTGPQQPKLHQQQQNVDFSSDRSSGSFNVAKKDQN